MSHQEKNIVAMMIANLVVLAIFYPRVSTMYLAGRFDGADGLILLGKTGLVYIGVAIVVNVGATILFNILHAIVTGDESPSFVVDERDRMIETRGMQISAIGTGGGLILSMLALTWGVAAVPVFFLIVLSFAVGDFIANAIKLVMYRRGF